MNEQEFEAKLGDLIDAAVLAGIEIDVIQSALELRVMALQEQLDE